MTVAWNPEYTPDEIINKIEETKVLDGNGNATYQGFEHRMLVAVLYSMLHFPNSISENDGRAIVQRAVFQAGTNGKLTGRSLLAEVNRLVSDTLSLPKTRFVLVTSLSISSTKSLKIVNINGATIVFGRQGFRKYHQSRENLLNLAKDQIGNIPDQYLPVRIFVSARTIYEAVDNAFYALDLIRGIWNFLLNKPHYMRLSMGKRTPVNQIVIGPVHTLHLPNGTAAAEIWWYESRYSGDRKLFDATNLEKLYNNTTYLRKRLKQSNYPKVIESALVNYARALDESDWDTSFLKLWSILEQLSGFEDSYKPLIRRVSFLFSDRELSQQILKHLKDFRNSYVHHTADNSEIETYLYQLKNFVEAMIQFHLSSRFGFKSLKEASEFLDMPTSKVMLEYRLRITKYAIDFLKLT